MFDLLFRESVVASQLRDVLVLSSKLLLQGSIPLQAVLLFGLDYLG